MSAIVTKLPTTHTLKVFVPRRVPCLNFPATFPAKHARPGVVYSLFLQADHYVVIDLTSIEANPTDGEEVEVQYGWLKNDLEEWSRLPEGDERRVALMDASAPMPFGKKG